MFGTSKEWLCEADTVLGLRSLLLMKLKSGCVYWPQVYGGATPAYPPLDRDISCDAVIVGGGVSGALIAYSLNRAGIGAVLLDRRPIGHGSTAASTGLLQYEIDTPLVELSKMIGPSRARLAYRASMEALLAFEPLVAALDDRCGLAARPSLYLASEPAHVEALRAEAALRREIGIDVEFLEARRLREQFSMDRPAALLSVKAFEIDPFALTLKLVQCAAEAGLNVFTPVDVKRLTRERDRIVLYTAAGPRVSARRVIFATGYETMEEAPTNLCRLTSTYALVSEPMKGWNWFERCLIWETARPYFYIRSVGDRVMMGGADEEIAAPERRDALLKSKTARLQKDFAALTGKSIDAACAWAGTFAQTRDGLPYIGERKGYPGCLFVMGYGGNGITFSMVAAKIALARLRGEADPYGGLFGFERGAS